MAHAVRKQDLTVSVPQGSCAGVSIFNLYCGPIGGGCHTQLKNKWVLRMATAYEDSFKASNRKAELDSTNTIQKLHD